VVGWLGTCLAAVVANTWVEAVILIMGFKVPMRWREFGLLALANAVSVGIALAFLVVWYVRNAGAPGDGPVFYF